MIDAILEISNPRPTRKIKDTRGLFGLADWPALAAAAGQRSFCASIFGFLLR